MHPPLISKLQQKLLPRRTQALKGSNSCKGI